jgi:mxaD protein
VLSHEQALSLNAAPQTAWEAIKRFDRIDSWHPGTCNCRLLVGENGKPLAVREFELPGGGFVISELLAYDEARRWFRYRILKTSLPLRNYVGEMRVEPRREGGSLVLWSAEFERPAGSLYPGRDDAATYELVREVFRTGLEGVAKASGG